MPTDKDKRFVLAAREKGLLDDKQTKELLTGDKRARESEDRGEPPQTLSEKAVSSGLLTQEQADEIAQALLPKDVPRRLGRYRVLERLGEGGMGTVYRARDPELKRIVAIKTLRPGLAANEKFMVRFRHEAEIAAQLRSPNVVQVYDRGRGEEIEYLVMEFVRGESLGLLLKREKRLPENRVVQIALEVLDGLAEAHRNRIIHRDIKPDNIFLTAGGRAKLGDLGIAKDTSGVGEGLTGANIAMGTPGFMPPEQVRDAAHVDLRADVYALGATLYCLLAGGPPFTGTVIQIYEKQMEDNLKPLQMCVPDVSAELSDIVARMTAREPTKRYASCEEVMEALRPLAVAATAPGARGAESGIPTAQVAQPERSGGGLAHAAVSVIGVVCLLAAAGYGIYMMREWTAAEEARRRAARGSTGSTAAPARHEPRGASGKAVQDSGEGGVAAYGSVMVVCENVERAEVYVDDEDRPRGMTPLTLENIPAGGHKITVKKAGFAPVVRRVTVRAGGNPSVDVSLAPPYQSRSSGLVVRVANGQVHLDLGSRDGLRRGMLLMVRLRQAPIRGPGGAVLGYEETELKVVGVTQKGAVAERGDARGSLPTAGDAVTLKP